MDGNIESIVAIVTAIGTIAVHLYIVKDTKRRVGILETKMDAVIQQRNDDVLSFTEALALFNTTLGKIDITLKNLDNTIHSVQETQKIHDKDIRDILIKQANGK